MKKEIGLSMNEEVRIVLPIQGKIERILMNSLLHISLFLVLFFGLNNGISYAVLPSDYNQQKAEWKQTFLWREILRTQYAQLPTVGPDFIESTKLLFPSYLRDSFTNNSDEMPLGRKKLLHSFGSVAQIEFQIYPGSSPFTGIFRTGGRGLARLSLGTLADGDPSPGLGMKIFIDGKHSINFHATATWNDEEKGQNFFSSAFSNRVDIPLTCQLKFMAAIFRRSVNTLSNNPSERPSDEKILPLYEASRVTSSGEIEETPLEPFKISFIPIRPVTFDPDSKKDLREELRKIPEGTLLFYVAVRQRSDAPDQVIGKVITRSPFIASEFGDEKLFFQHQRYRRIGATYPLLRWDEIAAHTSSLTQIPAMTPAHQEGQEVRQLEKISEEHSILVFENSDNETKTETESGAETAVATEAETITDIESESDSDWVALDMDS